MLERSRVVVLGLGTMGRAIAGGLTSSGSSPAELRGAVRSADQVDALAARLDFPVTADNLEAVRSSDLVLLCVKPKRMAEVLGELASGGALDHDPLLVSIAAGLTTADLERFAALHEVRVVRAMPNTPLVVHEGMTVLSAGSRATEADLDLVEAVFRPLGRVMRLDEEYMDTVTGLAASGPAFVYVMIEALSEGGVMMGLPRKVAVELAAQMMHGAARMVLETGEHPAALKDEVTTPAGCTISALLTLEDGNIRSVLARGVQEASRAAAALRKPD